MPFRLPSFRQAAASVIAVTAVVGAVGAVGVLSTPTAEAPSEIKPMVVLVSPTAWQDSTEDTARYLGEIQARQRVNLSFELNGTIDLLGADEGDRVPAGTVVARLDTARLLVDLRRLEAAARAISSDLDLAEITLERVDQTIAANAATQQQRDEAASAVRTLRARLAEAQAAVQRTRVDIDKSTLRAPFDALVARRFADIGSLARPGTPVLTLLERSDPEARIGVAPGAVPFVNGDTHVIVRSRRVPARLVDVLPEIDRVTRTAEVRFVLPEQLGPTLRDGDAAEIEITRPVDEDGFWVPLSALTQSVRGLWALYIAVPAGGDGWVLERREVEIVRPATGRAFVRGALEDGDLIVTDGKQRLVPGMRVRPIESAAFTESVDKEIDR